MTTATQMRQDSGYQAGRDINIFNYQGGRARISFFDLKVAELEPHRPPEAAALAALARANGLVVIETVELDHRVIGRDIAASLHDQLAGERPAIRIREWEGADGGLLDIDTELKRSQDTQILVLPGAARTNFGDVLLSGLANRLKSYGDGHFAILVTELGREQWQVEAEPDGQSCYWRNRTRSTYYTGDFLRSALNRELELFGKPVDRLLAGVPIEDVATRLGDPARVRGFAAALRDSEPKSAPEVISLVDGQIGDRQVVQRWFRDLGDRGQLMALGLILFNDLPADQVFAGVESLVDQVWRPNQPLFAHFDYRDVEPLRRCFELLPGGVHEGRIAITVENRRWLFEVAWLLHRRRILASLPALATMVQGAVNFLDRLGVDAQAVAATPASGPPPTTQSAPSAGSPQPAQSPAPSVNGADRQLLWRMSQGRTRELYGTVRRTAGLQRATADSLSQIGRISFDAIEPCLREMAATDSPGVHRLVAEALAASHQRDRAPGAAPRVLGALLEWWEGAGKTNPGESEDRRREKAAIRATIALALGGAAAHDVPGQIAEPLVGLFEQIGNDGDPAVHAGLRDILPDLLARHLKRLEPVVSGAFCRQPDRLDATAIGVARAYLLRPAETCDILAAWHQRARDMVQVAQEDADHAAMLTCLVARALGFLPTQHDDPFLPPVKIFSLLRSILVECRQPSVRHQTLIAVGCQALHNTDLAAPLLIDLLGQVTLEDRAIAIGVFVATYLQQRRELRGGDLRLQIDDYWYAAWLSGDRPLTAIESALLLWLNQHDQPVAQQIATQTFAALSATELDTEERAAAARTRGASAALPAPTAPTAAAAPPPVLHGLGPLGWAALFMAAHAANLRAGLWAPFAEILSIQRQRAVAAAVPAAGELSSATPWRPTLPALASIEELFRRWRSLSAEPTRSNAGYLEKALGFYRSRWAYVFLALVLSMLLLLVTSAVVATHHG